MPLRIRKSRVPSGEAPNTARRREIKGSFARTAHRMLTLTFTSVGHPECVLSTARWRLRRASTRRVGPLFRRGGSPELRASSLVGSWGAHRLSTRWNMSTDNRLAEPPGDRNTASTGSPLWRIPERRASGNSAFSRRRFSAHGSPIVRSQPQLVSRSTNEKCSPTPPLDATRSGDMVARVKSLRSR